MAGIEDDGNFLLDGTAIDPSVLERIRGWIQLVDHNFTARVPAALS